MIINYTNLRCSDGVLRPVGKPFVHDSMSACTPLGRLGGEILYANGSHIFRGEAGQGLDLGSKVLCATVRNDKEALVMTESGAVTVRLQGSGLVREERPVYPAVRLVAAAASILTADVEKRTLSTDFTVRRFSDRDTSTLVNDLCDAYCRLCSNATAAGVAIQPALVRYKLIDTYGRTVYVSPTLYLSHPTGAQCTGYTDLYRLEGTTVRGYTLEAHPWSLEVLLPAADMSDIARLDVMMTPLFHPYDNTMQPPLIMGARSAASDAVARIALPGFSRDPGGKYGQRIVGESLARIGNMERRVASIHQPFNGESRTVKVALAPSAEPQDDTRNIKSLLAVEVAVADRTEALLNAGFSAEKVADSGSTLMWSGVRALRSVPVSPEIFASDGGVASNWTATIGVRFSGDRWLTGLYSGIGGLFRELGAILSYPSADAEELRVSISSGGKYYGASFELKPDSANRSAVYISPSMARISLPEIAAPLTFGTGDSSEDLGGVAVFTGTREPLSVKGYCDLGSPCTALVGRQGLNQAWDFGRSRFLAATPAAFLTVAVGANGAVSLNKLSERGAGRADAIASADDGSVYMILAEKGRDSGGIYRLTATGRIEVFEIDDNYRALAWSSSFSELWALRDDGGVTVFGPGDTFNRDDIILSGFVGAAGEAFAVCDDGPAELGRETLTDCHVAMRQEFDVAGFPGSERRGAKKKANIRSLMLNVSGYVVTGGASVTATAPDGRDVALIRSIAFTGTCVGPVKIPLLVRMHRRLRLKFDATVGASFRLAVAA